LVFLDPDFNECPAINPDYAGPSDAQVDFTMERGGVSRHPARECISTELAFKALAHFCEFGSKPDWLRFEGKQSAGKPVQRK
jgi:hypothetical protein